LAAGNRSPKWDTFLTFLAPAPGDKILDVGSGDCSKAARVMQASEGAEVYAVDPNEKRITTARHQYPQVKSSVAGAESLPFPDSQFDKAYSTMALHHFADLDRSLGEIARVLKPGGSYVIAEVEPRSLNGRLFRLFGRLMGEKMQIMTKDQLLARVGSGKGFSAGRSADLGGSYVLQLTRT